MLIQKFGGTSVENAAAMHAVADIVLRAGGPVLVVASACAGVTDRLIEAARCAAAGDEPAAREIVRSIEQRHVTIAHALVNDDDRREVVAGEIVAMCAELGALCRGLAILGECTSRSLDTFTSFGERLSTTLLHAELVRRGARARLFDARRVMITDDAFGRAVPDRVEIARRVAADLLPCFAEADVIVTQGFIGATPDGVTTTIGRGGSDYTAALLGAAAGVDEVQIWTDVAGILTADPRLVPDARTVPALTFREAEELAYFGAKVLHPETIAPAVETGIPVRVLSTREPASGGTVITAARSAGSNTGAKSIALKTDITVITVSSPRAATPRSFAAGVLAVLARSTAGIYAIATSDISVSIAVDATAPLTDITGELAALGHIAALQPCTVLCVVGEIVRGVSAKLFTSLAGVKIEMISQAASATSIVVVVAEVDAERALKAVHAALFR